MLTALRNNASCEVLNSILTRILWGEYYWCLHVQVRNRGVSHLPLVGALGHQLASTDVVTVCRESISPRLRPHTTHSTCVHTHTHTHTHTLHSPLGPCRPSRPHWAGRYFPASIEAHPVPEGRVKKSGSTAWKQGPVPSG